MTTVTQRERVNINEILMKEKISEEEAILIAKEIERIEGVERQLKNKLKEYVSVYGAVYTDDNEWNNFEYERIAFDSKAVFNLVEYLQYLGKDPFEFLTVDKRQLNKLGLEQEILVKLGADFKTSTQFRKKKIKK